MFLALGLGILMGSVVLSDRYVGRLENRVKSIEGQLDQRREDVVALTERVEVLQDFSSQAQARLLDDVLMGSEVVVVELPGADGALRDSLTESIRSAEGEVSSTILLTERFALEDESSIADLASILQSTSTEAVELRAEAARMLGQRAAAAAARGESFRGTSERLASLIVALRDADFVDATPDPDALIPPGSAFLLLGGATQDPVVGTGRLALELVSALATRGAPVVVAEPSDSVWALVANVRDDAGAGAAATTVDGAESVPGQIAVVLGLELTINGVTGHYGTEDGATAIVPPATPGD